MVSLKTTMWWITYRYLHGFRIITGAFLDPGSNICIDCGLCLVTSIAQITFVLKKYYLNVYYILS